MNSREAQLPMDDLDARIRQGLRAAYGHKYPPPAVRRQLLERAAAQRRALRKLTLSLSEGRVYPRAAFPVERGWRHLDYINLLSALGFVGVTYAIR